MKSKPSPSPFLILARVQSYATALAFINGGVLAYYQPQDNLSHLGYALPLPDLTKWAFYFAIGMSIILILTNILVLRTSPNGATLVLPGYSAGKEPVQLVDAQIQVGFFFGQNVNMYVARVVAPVK